MSRWILLVDNYEGISQKAVNMLSGVISGYLKYVLPVKYINNVTDKEIKDYNIITVGKKDTNRIIFECESRGLLNTPQSDESYSVFVGESVFNREMQMIAISGFDNNGVLYGCMQFCNKYCGEVICRGGDLWSESFYETLFDRKLPEWKTSDTPAVKHRALWTWGHVIYDYRKYFENMARLRLNEAVIWNDRVPFNAKEVVDYAHSLGIKVIWGFSWGWGVSCEKILESFDEQVKKELKSNVLNTYKTEYAKTGCDGIYFQSFTELQTDYVGGKCIAECVTELVNDISVELLSQYPDLHIQFGLHATSVRTHLEMLKNVDKRIHIVWEDCGAFPYSYWADDLGDFDNTIKLTNELLTLRGNEERFGAVFKGMLKLDWNTFEHFDSPYILGERTNGFIENRQIKKNRIWKTLQASWLKNAEYVRKTIKLISDRETEPIIEALVEDGMLENKIMLPVALYAELLWTPESDVLSVTEQVAQYPCVEFSNINPM